MKIIPYGRQSINSSDIDAVVEVLKSDYLTQGPMVPRFEQMVASHCGVEYAVAVNSATSALHIACLALGLGEGDWLWTSPNTFVASANCARYCGANVDFVDIDPRTYNLSVNHLAEKLMVAEKNGRLPKIVIPVHYAGQSCEMEAIGALGKKYGFRIIEDASHAIGGKYQKNFVGSCQYSDITVFSFHPVKIITTGEGGMAVTNDAALARRMQILRSHGITSNFEEMDARSTEEIWNYQQIELGFNYRMTDILAALGVSQMERLDEFVKLRHEIAARYNEALCQLPFILPSQHPDTYSSYHLYPIRVRGELTQRKVYDALLNVGINVNLHYISVYLQPYYEKLGFCRGHCPEAERYYQEAISLPIFPSLSIDAQQKVIDDLMNAI